MQRKRREPKPEVYGPHLPVWRKFKFTVRDVPLHGYGNQWVAAYSTLERPLCWTPAKPFYFGGKDFVWGYPCIAYATQNFGWVVQKGPHGVVIGRE